VQLSVLGSIAPSSATGESLADRAETAIQNAVISGELLPSARLALPRLAEKFGIGVTPIREALSRLVAKGFVTLTENKGFSVAQASLPDLIDITATRCVIETAALKRSMERRDPAWEDGIIVAIRRYTKVTLADGNASAGSHIHYDDAHRAFHVALVAGCGLPRLLELQGSLYDQAYRYRRLMMAEGLDPGLAVAEHQQLADLALSERVEEACTALEAHLHLTLSHVYPHMTDAPPARHQKDRPRK
jgi:GntR family carbon starvation induced transcriptional regulator